MSHDSLFLQRIMSGEEIQHALEKYEGAKATIQRQLARSWLKQQETGRGPLRLPAMAR